MIVCADDFGISPSVNEGILELCAKQSITAVSCMLNFKEADNYFSDLSKFYDSVDIGLHINLTCGNYISRPEQKLPKTAQLLTKMIISPKFRHLLKKEIQSQYARFTSVFGFSPIHIDAHHHLHQYPIFRNILAQSLQEMGYKRNIRICRFPKLDGLYKVRSLKHLELFAKSVFVDFYSHGAKKIFNTENFKTNNHFFGCHGTVRDEDVARLFEYYLSLSKSRSDILMVHPGYIDETLKARDSLTNERVILLNFLKSSDYLNLLKAYKTQLLFHSTS